MLISLFLVFGPVFTWIFCCGGFDMPPTAEYGGTRWAKIIEDSTYWWSRNKKCCVALSYRPPKKTLTTGKHPIFVRLGIFWEKKVVNALKFCTFGCFKDIFSNWPTRIFSNSTWGQHNNFLLLAWWGKGGVWTVWYPVTSLGCSQQTYIGLLAIIS